MSNQVTSSILMIRPVSFNANPETAQNNYYQKLIEGLSPEQAQEKALFEFNHFVDVLKEKGIDVVVVDDTSDPETPDAVFPNNWISFHHDGTIALYPMFAESRRLERRDDIIDILKENGFVIERVRDYTAFEHQSKYLEGTGSMILDRDNHILYAALSARTNQDVLETFAEDFSYKLIAFNANQSVAGKREPIYHTNVLMGLTDKIAIICLETIDNKDERNAVVDSLKSTGKEIIEITEDQVNYFAGNILGLKNRNDEEFLIMSDVARKAFSENQIENIKTYYEIISAPLDTIEALGGGGARCMIAEVFLPKTEV
ncbi:MAG: arginine deiminase-related protein [Bacteroidota bacterium]